MKDVLYVLGYNDDVKDPLSFLQFDYFDDMSDKFDELIEGIGGYVLEDKNSSIVFQADDGSVVMGCKVITKEDSKPLLEAELFMLKNLAKLIDKVNGRLA